MKFLSAIFAWIFEELQWRMDKRLFRSMESEVEMTKEQWRAIKKHVKDSGFSEALVVVSWKLKLTSYYPKKCHKKYFNGVKTKISYSYWNGTAYFPFLKSSC